MANPVDNQNQQPNPAQQQPTQPLAAQQQSGSLQAELEATRAQLEEMKDKYLRALAEMDNVRKQQERRSADRIKQEKKTLFLRLVEVVDDLERALSYQDVADRETLLNSLRLTYNQITTLLQREGVVSFVSQGDTFNPHMHDAVESVDNSGKPEGHIVQEMQKGYRYGDELLRPARVHVSSGQGDQNGGQQRS